MEHTVTFKAIRAAIVGGALTGIAGALTGGSWKTIVIAGATGALMAVSHLFQDNPLNAKILAAEPKP